MLMMLLITQQNIDFGNFQATKNENKINEQKINKNKTKTLHDISNLFCFYIY